MSINIDTWYRLTNAETGPETALDVVNQDSDDGAGDLVLDTLATTSGQYWQLARQSSNVYHLTTLYLGPGKLLNVVVGSNGTQVHLTAPTGNGCENWTLQQQTDETYKFSNACTGSSYFLDYCASTKSLCLQVGDNPGQHWTVTSIGGISPTDPAYSSTPAGTTSSPSTTQQTLPNHSTHATTTCTTSSSAARTFTLHTTPKTTYSPSTSTTSSAAASYTPASWSTSSTTLPPSISLTVSPLPSTTDTSILPFYPLPNSSSTTLISSPYISSGVPTPSGEAGVSTTASSAASATTSVNLVNSSGAASLGAGSGGGLGSLVLLAWLGWGLWRRW